MRELVSNAVDASQKLKAILDQDFGYEIFYLEHGVNVYMPNTNVYPAKELQPKEPFSKLIEFIDNFYTKSVKNLSPESGIHAVSYCTKCKQLIIVSLKGPYICNICNISLI